MILRKLVLCTALSLTAFPAVAQETAPAQPPAAEAPDAATLADLRVELRQLTDELQGLRTQLVASGAAGFQAAGGDSAIDRMNAMEAQMMRLTGQTEQLQNQIERVVRDGTRRIGDIEFRLCEMDPTCDLGALMSQPDLGSRATGGGAAPAPSPAPETTGATPSTAEQQDFDRAQEVLGQGDFRRAAELFAALAQTHAGGPLTAEALFLRGSALDSAGAPDEAASAWLEAFAADPNGGRAAESLLGLARIIGDKGDPVAACLYLSEIPVRFAGSDHATEAERRMTALNCGASEEPADIEIDPEAAADAETGQDG